VVAERGRQRAACHRLATRRLAPVGYQQLERLCFVHHGLSSGISGARCLRRSVAARSYHEPSSALWSSRTVFVERAARVGHDAPRQLHLERRRAARVSGVFEEVEQIGLADVAQWLERGQPEARLACPVLCALRLQGRAELVVLRRVALDGHEADDAQIIRAAALSHSAEKRSQSLNCAVVSAA